MKNLDALLKTYCEFNKGQTAECKAELDKKTQSQSPDVLFITCSDSRIVLEKMFKSEPGDLFVIRNAGNIITKAELGTIQFAVDVLKVKNIVVCGHTDCGAVKGLLDLESLSSLPHLSDWLNCCDQKRKIETSKSITENIQNNVLNQVDVLNKEQFIRSRVDEDKLKIHSWVLDLSNYEITSHSDDDSNWSQI